MRYPSGTITIVQEGMFCELLSGRVTVTERFEFEVSYRGLRDYAGIGPNWTAKGI